jgi:biotin synthase
MLKTVMRFVDKVSNGGILSVDEALQILNAKGAKLTAFMAGAQNLKEKYCGEGIELCSIINAKSGQCNENCSFCAQSVHHQAKIKSYPLKSREEIVHGAMLAQQSNCGCYGIVTSGSRIVGEEFEELLQTIRQIRRQTTLVPSVSIGLLDAQSAKALVEAGCGTCHHNLETARSFFPQICSTHDYDEDIATVRVAKDAGMKVCCGGLFGLGESQEQRIELGLTLRELDVDAVPLNFLSPIPGTPLADQRQLTPLDCLRIICLYRYLLPEKKISVCGGREDNLREFQSAIFMAGASGMMIGNYLTRAGRNLNLDRQLLVDAKEY